MANLFGYYLVQLGCTSDTGWLHPSRIANKVLLDDALQADTTYPGADATPPDDKQAIKRVKADLDYLPIARESVDVMLLPHTLETVQDPYYLLRQVDAMLVPEGHLVLTGFNPLGCAVIKARLSRDGHAFRHASLVSSAKVVEWLEVLGYDIEHLTLSSLSCFAGRPGVPSRWKALEGVERVLTRLGLQFGNVYCIVARKRVDAPRLVGLSWRRSRWWWPVGKPAGLALNRHVKCPKSALKCHPIHYIKERVRCKP